MEYKTIKWDRQQLYDAVWEKPAVQLAKEYGISDVGLAKICKKLDIPKPGLGYWRRRELGFKVQRTPLPSTKKNSVAISRVPVHAEECDQIPDQFKAVLNPPRTTARRHPTVSQTRRAFRRGRLDDYGRLNPSDWRLPRFDLRVTKSSLQRALAFMDELVKLADANGVYAKGGTEDETHVIYFNVESEHIRITVREPVRRKRRELTKDEKRDHERYPSVYPAYRYTFEPSGILVFEINNYSDARRTWTDTKNQKLEEDTHEIVFAMRAAAAYQKRVRAEREAEEARRIAEERRRRRQQERIERLKRNVANWEEAERIRAYLAAVRKKVEAQKDERPDYSLMQRFLNWAQDYADSLDPSDGSAAPDWAEQP